MYVGNYIIRSRTDGFLYSYRTDVTLLYEHRAFAYTYIVYLTDSVSRDDTTYLYISMYTRFLSRFYSDLDVGEIEKKKKTFFF